MISLPLLDPHELQGGPEIVHGVAQLPRRAEHRLTAPPGAQARGVARQDLLVRPASPRIAREAPHGPGRPAAGRQRLRKGPGLGRGR